MADLLIRGMEMPKPGERRFALFVGADGVVDVYEARGGATLEYYLFETEAVELPDHDDLIDRAELLRSTPDVVQDDMWVPYVEGYSKEAIMKARPIIPASKEGGE